MLVITVVLAVLSGLALGGLEARRLLADPAVPGVDVFGRPTAPTFAFDFSGPEEQPLLRPVSVSATDERLYVSDSLAGHVAVYRHGGSLAGTIGAGRLVTPLYVELSPDGEELFVTDRAHAAVLVFTTVDGSFVETITPAVVRTVETTPAASVEATAPAAAGASPAPSGETTPAPSAETTAVPFDWAPIAVAAADDGTLFVSDVSDVHRVWHVERGGTVIDALPGPDIDDPSRGFDFPNAVESIGERVWVVDSNNRRLQEFVRGSLVRSLPLGRLIRGLDVVLAEENAPVYFALADTFSHQVILVSDTGSEIARAGEPGTGPGQLNFPNDVAVQGGVVWIVDTGNARIQAWEWGAAARTAAAAVWPGGPSWLGLLAVPLLLSPLGLLVLLRRVRAAVSPETVPLLSSEGAHGTWARVRLFVSSSAGEPTYAETLPPIDAVPTSPSDIAMLRHFYGLEEEQAETLSIALRTRMLVTDDRELAIVARARGVEVYDPAGFAAEFLSAGIGGDEPEENQQTE